MSHDSRNCSSRKGTDAADEHWHAATEGVGEHSEERPAQWRRTDQQHRLQR